MQFLSPEANFANKPLHYSMFYSMPYLRPFLMDVDSPGTGMALGVAGHTVKAWIINNNISKKWQTC
jgi:hypothetical protein